MTTTTWRRLAEDDEGAIMVIAVFMAAVLVGAIWYTFGLGEAMIYRQQLRQAVDASAFNSAVVHALGMNMLAMMNIAMAAVLSVLILMMVVFMLGLVVTVLDVLLLFVPFVDVAAAAALGPLLDFDAEMFSTIEEWQTPIFKAINAINVSEGYVAIIMPFAGAVASGLTAGDYGGAVASTSSFSPSMIPMRVPYYSNKLDSILSKKLPTIPIPFLPGGGPGGGLTPAPTKIPLLQRYGLPVQDDTYGMLCLHAGQQLVEELGELATLASLGLIPNTGPIKAGEKLVGQWFGEVTGALPWLFCSGVDPLTMLGNLAGGGAVSKAAGFIPVLKSVNGALSSIAKAGKDAIGFSMNPMKPFDESKNGNGFMQVYGSATGNSSLTTGAEMGVAIAGFESGSPSSGSASDGSDFAEAEFYFDCGAPGTGDDEVILGTSDTSGDWQDCKYNAMWNLRWKARLRRYHQFEWDIRKDIELSIYQGLGIDGFFKGLLPGFLQEGSLAKTQWLDRAKACLTSLGSGSNTGTGDFGGCLLPVGTWGPSFPNGGKIGIGPSAPDGFSMSDVLH
jgi:hypothetical protein